MPTIKGACLLACGGLPRLSGHSLTALRIEETKEE